MRREPRNMMTKQEIQAIIQKQKAFFQSGKTKPVEARLDYLQKLKSALMEYEDSIIEASRKDIGRADVETFFTEVNGNIDELTYAIRNVQKWTKPRKVKTPLWLFPSQSRVYPEPYGTVVIISAWNFPFMQLIAPLTGAIAAGNTAILKPSPESPVSARVVETIIKGVFPPEYVAVVLGDTAVTSMLLQEEFDYIFFTGSSRVGRIVSEAAAKYLTPVTLELGGKSPAIVDTDADLDQAAKSIVWAKNYTAGQVCVTVDHVYVHTAVKQRFIKCLTHYLKQFYGDEPLASPDISCIIDERSFERAVGYLKEGRIVYGGQSDRATRRIAPTVLINIPPEARVLQEEIFAPILPVIDFADIKDVIEDLKRKPKPLALYYFSRSAAKQKKVIAETSSGGVTINDTMAHGSSVYLPFGGVGNSGMGTYHGRKTFDTFTHYKPVLRRNFLYDPPIKYPPYRGKLEGIKKFLGMLPPP